MKVSNEYYVTHICINCRQATKQRVMKIFENGQLVHIVVTCTECKYIVERGVNGQSV